MNMPAIAPPPDELIPIRELADQVGIPLPTVRGWYCKGVNGNRLRIFRRGGRVFSRPSDMAAFTAAVNRDCIV